MKKITLLILAGLVAMIAQAGVINSDKAAKLQNAKANVTVKAEGDIVTPPAGAEQMLYNFQGHDTYIDQDKTFEVFVVIDNNDIYVKGFSEYLTEGWVKGTIADGVATFPAAFMGVFEFWGDAYDLDFDGAVFTVSDDASELFAADGYTTSVEGEVQPLTTRIRARNKELEILGSLLAKFTQTQSSYDSNATGSSMKPVQGITEEEIPLGSEAYRKKGGTPGSTLSWWNSDWSKASVEGMISMLKTMIDSRNNESQTDMSRLQSLVDRRDESYSTATNLMSAVSDTRSNLIRNL